MRHRLAFLILGVGLPALVFAACSGADNVDVTDGTQDGSTNPSADTSVNDDATTSDTSTGSDGSLDAEVDANTNDGGADAQSEAGTDSGSDGDATTDSGAEAGSDAGDGGNVADASDSGADADAGCTLNATKCDGDQPMICNAAGTYVNNGGICNYGCVAADAGAMCNCSAPNGRLIFQNTPVVQDVMDTTTGRRFVRQTIAAWTDDTNSDAVAHCGPPYGVPTVAQFNTIVSQRAESKFCNPDHDPGFSSQGVQNGIAWTRDACGVGKHYTFSLLNGSTACEDDSNQHETWCVQ